MTWQLTTNGDNGDTGAATVNISPAQGLPGTEVIMTADGLPPNVGVNIGVGPWGSEYEVVQTAQTDGNGELMLDVEIPDYADDGDEYVIVVAEDVDTPSRFKVSSNRFEVSE